MSVAMSQNEKDCVDFVYNLPVCYIIYKYKKKKIYIYIYIYVNLILNYQIQYIKANYNFNLYSALPLYLKN